MLTSIEKIDALVVGVTKTDVESMPPAKRQRLAQVLRYIADLADPPPKDKQPTSGVLSELSERLREG